MLKAIKGKYFCKETHKARFHHHLKLLFAVLGNPQMQFLISSLSTGSGPENEPKRFGHVSVVISRFFQPETLLTWLVWVPVRLWPTVTAWPTFGRCKSLKAVKVSLWQLPKYSLLVVLSIARLVSDWELYVKQGVGCLPCHADKSTEKSKQWVVLECSVSNRTPASGIW